MRTTIVAAALCFLAMTAAPIYACEQWRVQSHVYPNDGRDLWFITQPRLHISVLSREADGEVLGRASYEEASLPPQLRIPGAVPRMRYGQVRGRIEGNEVRFSIDWTRMLGDPAKVYGAYRAVIGADGIARGEAWQVNVPNTTVAWESSKFVCRTPSPGPLFGPKTPPPLFGPPRIGQEEGAQETAPVAGAAPSAPSRTTGAQATTPVAGAAPRLPSRTGAAAMQDGGLAKKK